MHTGLNEEHRTSRFIHMCSFKQKQRVLQGPDPTGNRTTECALRLTQEASLQTWAAFVMKSHACTPDYWL